MSVRDLSAGGTLLRVSAVAFLFGPASVHLAVVPAHLSEYLPYGIFSLVVGFAQMGLAAGLVFRPSSALLLSGAAGNLLVIGVWLATRTIGLPGVPGMPEAEALPDLISNVTEFVAIVLMLLADVRVDRANTRIRLAVRYWSCL
jgi:hypothetical protein